LISPVTIYQGSHFLTNKKSNLNDLLDCAPNLIYFEAKNNVIDFTLNTIQKNDSIE
jgi:hypothetical protein